MRTPAKRATGDSEAFVRHNEAPQQLDLVHEEPTDLLRSLVAVLGGAKRVGHRLWPTRSEDSAQKRVLECLNPDREGTEFKFDEILTLLRWAREAGAHFGFYWICDQLLYSHPAPVNPEDVRTEVQREYIKAVAQMEQLARRLGK